MSIWSPWITGVVITLALSVPLASAAQPVKRLYSKDTRFWVQFKLPTSASAKDSPREVELHASSNQGATWEVVGTAKPSDRGVLFHAPADGEYWFMPRTKYGSGKYLPQGPPLAELIVIVDTAQPELDLDARNDDGEVVIRWQASDVNLKPETFNLEYRVSAPNAKWQKVAVDKSAKPQSSVGLRGETTVVLPIPEQAMAIVVRAEVSDSAGNRSVKEQPLAAPSNLAGTSAHAAHGGNDAPPEMSATFQGRANDETRRPATPPSYPQTATPDWPAEESGPLAGDSAARRETAPRPVIREASSASFNRSVQRLRDLPEANPATDAGIDELSPPPGVQPHLVNKPRFELDYDVDAIGSAGVVQVELWMTTDCGRTWATYGLDEDCRSPVVVKVKGEGLYGFRVVVETTTGLRSPAPIRGDLPDVWVEVDVTRPEARLLSASQGTDEEADRLVICWEASDRHLAGRGIALRWSETAQGPWNTIASGLENTGRYAWRLDQRVPRQLYLQLEARDDAGNVSTNQFAQPVSLDLVRPQGRIREVRPLGAAPSAGKRL